MVVCRVKKVDAVALLDATKLTLDELGRARMEMPRRGEEADRRLVGIYADFRRLRDFIQRSIAVGREEVELAFAEPDLPLLVASFRRCVEHIEQRLAHVTEAPVAEWLVGKRDLLLRYALELADEAPIDLPLPKLQAYSAELRAFELQLTRKVLSRRAAKAGTTLPSEEPALFVPLPAVAVDGSPLPGVAPAGAEAPTGLSPPHIGEVRPFGTTYRIGPEPGAGELAVAPATPAAVPPPDAPLARPFDVSKLRDPRLRSLLSLDVRAMERALAAADFRMAAVHLGSVLEGYLLDVAIPRAAELGLAGPAEGWNALDMLLRLFRDHCSPADRAMASKLFSAHRLIRPAKQLSAPCVVTAQIFQELLLFAQRVLHLLGFRSEP